MSTAVQRVLASLPLREGKSKNTIFGWWSLEQNPILIALWEASNSLPTFVHLLGELALCVLPEKLSELAFAVQICLVGLENTGMKQSHSMHLLLQVRNFVDTSKCSPSSAGAVDHSVLDAAVDLAAAVLKANNIGPLVFITPELGKWSNVGGLSTMVNELTQGLARAPFNLDITVVSPYYDQNSKGETNYLQKPEYGSIPFKQTMLGIKVGSQAADVGIHVGTVNGVKLIFLHSPLFFPKTYPEGSSDYRMKGITLFAKASLEALCQLSIVPSIIITNDWFCGLVPAYVKDKKFFGQTFVGTSTFHIIHNLAQDYEGRVWPEPPMTIDHYNNIHGLPQTLLVDQFWSEKVMNPSRCALLKSDQWATVSVSYKEEILKESSLRSLLKSKFDKPFAYSNGLLVDVARKAVADKLRDCAQLSSVQLTRDTQLTHHVTAKEILQRTYFPRASPDPKVPLFAFVGRITKQKGIHLICDVAEALFKQGRNVQFIVGGGINKGEKYSEQQAGRLRALNQQYPEKFWANPGQFFSDGKLVNLGADWGLMPSEFEPGGIVQVGVFVVVCCCLLFLFCSRVDCCCHFCLIRLQHEFFGAGTPVIAFATGGLKDSVVQVCWRLGLDSIALF
jgi:starch synthase